MPAILLALLIAYFFSMSQTLYAADRPGAMSIQDLEYAQAEGVSLKLDASLPAGDGLAPAAIVVHGGAWVGGDRKRNVEPLLLPLANAGFAWFSISYRLASDPLQMGAAVSDVEAAVRFVKSHAEEYRIDPERIFLVGESAGGHLAAMAALGTSPGTGVRGVVALYAPTDLAGLAKTSTLIPEGIRKQLNGTPWERLLLARLTQLSPIGLVRAGVPPFLLIHGDDDLLVPIAQSVEMCRKMTSVGAKCSLVTVPNVGHGIRRWEAAAGTAESYKREMIAWMRGQSE